MVRKLHSHQKIYSKIGKTRNTPMIVTIGTAQRTVLSSFSILH